MAVYCTFEDCKNYLELWLNLPKLLSKSIKRCSIYYEVQNYQWLVHLQCFSTCIIFTLTLFYIFDNDYCDVITNSKRHSSLDSSFRMKHIIRIDRPPKIFFYRDFPSFFFAFSFSNQFFISLWFFFCAMWKAVSSHFIHQPGIDKLWTVNDSQVWQKYFKFQLCSNKIFNSFR